mgnify:CR=1 FL=1
MTTNINAALAQLRHMYSNMMGGEVRDTEQTKRMAQGLLAPAIEALEQAALTTAAAQPPETRDALGKRLIGEMLEADAIATVVCRKVAELPDRKSVV